MTNWQPIETAPRDGSWILLWRGAHPDGSGIWEPMIIGCWFEFDGESEWSWPDEPYDLWSEHDSDLAKIVMSNGGFYSSDDFTHWQPLPNPPKEAE